MKKTFLPAVLAILMPALLISGCGGGKDFQDRDDHSYYFQLGVANYKEGRYSEAVKFFDQSLDSVDSGDEFIKANPRHLANVYNYLGLSYLGGGMNEEAVNAFKKALEIDGSYVDIHNSLGNAYAGIGDTEKALEEFKTALNSPFLRTKAMANYNIGVVYLDMGKEEKAYYSLKKAMEQDAGLVLTYIKLGTLLERRQRYEEALEIYEKGAEEFSGNVELIHYQGIVNFKMGNTEKAAEKFNKVVDMDPNSEYGEEAMKYLNMIKGVTVGGWYAR